MASFCARTCSGAPVSAPPAPRSWIAWMLVQNGHTSTDAGPPASVDGGPFCTSIQAIQDLGAGGADTAAPEQVLAQNEAMLDLLDQATATVPAGAPAAVESLFDDYLSVADAIRSAGGDIEAAYAGLQEREPQVAARLFNATAHLPAFDYFARHCGIRFQ